MRIFLYGYSEPLDINIEGLDSILLGKELFIQIHFGGLCVITLEAAEKKPTEQVLAPKDTNIIIKFMGTFGFR